MGKTYLGLTYDGSSDLAVKFQNGARMSHLIRATHESGNVAKDSKTWNFSDPHTSKRYQIQEIR